MIWLLNDNDLFAASEFFNAAVVVVTCSMFIEVKCQHGTGWVKVHFCCIGEAVVAAHLVPL